MMGKIQKTVEETIQNKYVHSDIVKILKFLKAEFQRARDKELTDGQAIKIINRLIGSNKTMLKYARTDDEKEKLEVAITIMEELLPVDTTPKVSEEDVRDWIQKNIDFDTYNNKMQAMKPIMAHFGKAVDGQVVKGILASFE